MESLVPLQASCSMADLTRDWDQSLGNSRMVMRPSFPYAMWNFCPKHYNATALTAISDLSGTQSSDILGQKVIFAPYGWEKGGLSVESFTLCLQVLSLFTCAGLFCMETMCRQHYCGSATENEEAEKKCSSRLVCTGTGVR